VIRSLLAAAITVIPATPLSLAEYMRLPIHRPTPVEREGLPAKLPSAVGMSAKRLETIDRVIQRGIKAGGFPGAAVLVGRKGATVLERGYGRLGWTEEFSPVVPERSIYDLASLTKVIGTTTAVMLLYDEQKIELDAPVSRYIPEFTGDGKENVTIRMLLEHRSGLPAGRDLWRIAHSPEEARAAVISTPLFARPGQYYEYSDLGADMLGFTVEAITGEKLDTFLDRRVFKPLGMEDTEYHPDASLKARIAPTELTPPRGYPLRGEVHDENAYALGGVAGHAGLFSTAGDLSIFAQMMLNGGSYNGVRIISDSTVSLFTKRAAGTRALGWDTCANEHGGCGAYLGENAFGHTGFTGTSLWIDPDRDMFVILLTNRVYAAKARRPAKVIADVRADLADAAALAVTDMGGPLAAMPAKFRADKAVDWNKPVRAKRSKRSKSRSTKSKSSSHSSAKKPAAHKTTVKKK
jgi:CubicO group peptidase (beta-lactamase class C family)